MIKKLRWKFVAVCMALITLVLAAVFLSVYFAVEQNIEAVSRQVLHRVIQEETYSVGSPSQPDTGINIGGDRVQLPYFTVSIWHTGTSYSAYVTGGTYANLEDTEELTTILQECL